MENLETMKRFSATVAGLGTSGLLDMVVGEDAGIGVVTGEDEQGSKDGSSFHS